MSTVLFVPGYQENNVSRDYQSVLSLFEAVGHVVRFVHIDWKRTTAEDWVEQLWREYDKYDAKDTILAGFSFGALTAFIAASRKNPLQLWLFSLSPFFAEDLPHLKSWEKKQLGKHRVAAAEKLPFNQMAQDIKCPVKLFVGSKELTRWPEMKFRFEDSCQKLVTVEAQIIKGVGHQVEHPDYRVSIARTVSTI